MRKMINEDIHKNVLDYEEGEHDKKLDFLESMLKERKVLVKMMQESAKAARLERDKNKIEMEIRLHQSYYGHLRYVSDRIDSFIKTILV